MSLENAIRAKLLANAGVTALVDARISLVVSEQGAASPRITINVLSTSPEHHLQGATGLAQSLVQVDCWSETSVEAIALAAAVYSATDTYRGTSAGLFINSIKARILAINFTPEGVGSSSGDYRKIVELNVWHAQAVPSP